MNATTLAAERRSNAAGFTLIELLVVIVISAILISVTVLSVNTLGKDSQIQEETKRLDALIGMVHEQAEMQNRDYGLRIEEHGYTFLAYDVRTAQWLTIADDRLLRPRELPPGLNFRLYLEAREAVLKPPAGKDADDQKVERPPQIFLFSSGDLTAFELKLEREDSDNEATLTGSADGKIEVKRVDDAAT